MKRALLHSSWRQRVPAAVIIAVAIIGVIIIASEWEDYYIVLNRTDWRLVPPALGFTLLSYLCVGYSFAMVSRLLGVRMSHRDLTEIGFVTVILNHVVTTGGVAGYSVRYLLMEQQGAKTREVIAVTILHFYMTSMVMVAALPFGFIYLLTHAAMPRGVAITLGAATAILVTLTLIGALLLFVNSLRAPVLTALSRVARFIVRRDLSAYFDKLDDTLAQSVSAMNSRPWKVLAIWGVITIDWIAAAIVLGLCFDALGEPINLGTLATGFVVALIAGAVSMVPGGFGVQEASMAGIYSLLGVSVKHALVAAILFRVIYYLIPYFTSLMFYGRLMNKERQRRVLPDTEI